MRIKKCLFQGKTVFIGDHPETMLECWCLGWITDAGYPKYLVLPTGENAPMYLYSADEPIGLAPIQKEMPDMEEKAGEVIAIDRQE